jgi:uncharacterized protein with FMN-binding domain
MPKRGLAALTITAIALVLLINFKTPDEPVLDRTTGNLAIVQPSAGTATVPDASSAPAATSAPAASAATSGSAASAKVDGPVVTTRYGPVQVEVVVANGKVADVVALQLPTGRRSGQISDYAEPILHDEALQAQSASIDLVSGATYTSDAYTRSLQAALDQAGVG